VFLRQLEYLAALDRERHFGRAADACHVSQPALSAGIRKLERELAVPLVRRGHQFEGFTPEGEQVLVWVRRTLAGLDGLEQEVARLRGGLEGTVRLGVIPTALPASTLITTRFRARHPRMSAELRSMTSREIAAGLANGELDAGITYLDNEPIADVEARPLWREQYLLLSAAESPLATAVTVPWATAATLRLCLLTRDMQHRRIVDAAFARAGATPEPAVETNSVATLIAHARTGIPGITAQTWLVAHSLPAGVRAIPLVDPVVRHTIGLVAPGSAQRSPVTEELLSLFAPLGLAEEITRLAAGALGPRRRSAPRA
jgi:DNA-binding transcriptional LysR family regulator